MDEIWIEKRGKRHGPYSTRHVLRAADDGKLNGKERIWWPGLRKWLPAEAALKELRAIHARHRAAERPRRRSRIAGDTPTADSRSRSRTKSARSSVWRIYRFRGRSARGSSKTGWLRHRGLGLAAMLAFAALIGGLFGMLNGYDVVGIVLTCATIFALMVSIPKLLAA